MTAKTLLNTVRYEYDAEGTLTKKVVLPANGTAQTTYFETGEDNNTVVRFEVPAPTEADPNGKQTVTCHSESDSFGRKVFDELQLGTGFVSRQFSYHVGAVTDEHKANAKLKSSATTQLVSQIILSDGTTLSYTYDNEERIASVTETRTENGEPVVTTTLYTYDALGQLLTETVNGEVVNAMEYDNYGNIKKKNGVAYSYDTIWKDLLTQVGEGDNCSISYDFQGNPTSYLGHTLTWEKGRQLKSFDNNTYTYNANGIRTSKTVNGVKHTYTLDGTKILREVWGNNTLVPLYDNEDSVCGILYNNTPYYFIKNLQGDVVSIVDKDAQTVARYSYDAWGVCSIVTDTSGCNISTINPFRYRGYYYDEEIGLYYLQSRYYDPVVGRFINSDSIEWLGTKEKIIETNIFAYCKNNCVNLSDDVGFGGIDALLSALEYSIDVLAKMIDLIGNSFIKERKALEKPIRALTNKQKNKLADIIAIQSETKKVSKRLGWIGHGIVFLTLVISFASSYHTGRDLPASLIELAIETFISLIEWGAGELFDRIARIFPYVGFLIGLIAGWLISYFLSKFFNSRKVAKITSKFKSAIKDVKISLENWVKYAIKSLNA